LNHAVTSGSDLGMRRAMVRNVSSMNPEGKYGLER
jgi:hypothetical protein